MFCENAKIFCDFFQKILIFYSRRTVYVQKVI
jgi:hypothetical protein